VLVEDPPDGALVELDLLLGRLAPDGSGTGTG
jgi:hypothetical protein